jgi:adenosylcobinamide kinase/adenosylcobinamide-phosphate guanylyltransferase
MGLRLIIGGARSGMSALAQTQAEAAARRRGGAPIMIATAEALDEEMAARIARHRAERGPGWRTLEAPLDLVAAVAELGAGDCAVIDCLTLWLSNLMFAERDPERETEALLEAATRSPAEIVLVTNEVGMSIVPENALARRFRDEAGRMNRRAAEAAGEVTVMFAGLPLRLKP